MPSQPLMVGESRLQPRVVSAVPGMLSPTPRTSSRSGARSRPAALRGVWRYRASSRQARCRFPGRRRHGRTSPARLQTPSWVRLRPIAAASTTPASALKTSRAGVGRRSTALRPARAPSRGPAAPTPGGDCGAREAVTGPRSARVVTVHHESGRTPRRRLVAGEDRDMRISPFNQLVTAHQHSKFTYFCRKIRM